MKNGKGRQIVKYRGKVGGLKERDNYFSATEFQREYEKYNEKEPSIGDYIDILLRRKWIFISCILVSVAITTVGSFLIKPLYRAEATIEIASEDPKITTFQEVMGMEAEQDEFYKTQYQLIRSKSLAKEVINTLQLESHPEFAAKENKSGFISFMKDVVAQIPLIKKESNPGEIEKKKLAREEKLMNSFLRGVKISPDTESRLFQVSFESHDPALSAKVINTLVDTYIGWVLERKLVTTKAAKEFLEKQLGEVKTKLGMAEEALSSFARREDIVSLDKDLNPTYKQLAELNDALSKAETERLEKEALYKELGAGNYSYLPQVISDPSMQKLNEDYSKLKSEYDNMAVIFKTDYPDMKRLAAQVLRVQSDIKERINGIAKSLKKDYETALAKESILRQRNDEQKKLVSQLNDKTAQYRILEREVNTNQSIYQNLLQRLKETEVTSAIKATNIQVVDYASTPVVPYKPNIKFNILLASLAGLMGGIFLTFILEHLDNTIKDEEEIKRHFPYPLLGAVPMIRDEETLGKIEKAVHQNPRSVISEAFRMIRTSIIYSSPRSRPLKLLLVTSTHTLEGKTTLASNLALSMVQSGRKVILVDADLRKPRLHTIFLSNGHSSGLSSFLLGEKRLSGVVHNTDVEGLDMIPSGPLTQNPTELLSSEKMKRLLKSLRTKYDYVVVDGAPVGGFADSRLLSTMVDGVLFVTSIGITQIQTLRASIDEILRLEGKIIGTIVNRLQSGRNKYGYNFYYYHSDEKDRKKKEVSSPKAEGNSRHTNAKDKDTAKKEPNNSRTQAASRTFISEILENDSSRLSGWITKKFTHAEKEREKSY